MKLHRTILEESKKIAGDNSQLSSLLASAALLHISKHKLFNNNYPFLSLALIDNDSDYINNETVLYFPDLSNVKPAQNDRLSQSVFPVYNHKEEDIDKEYVDNYGYYTEDYLVRDIKNIYIEQEKIDLLNNFKSMVEDSKDFKKLKQKIEKEQENNKNFIHILNQFLFSNKESNKDLKNFSKILENIVQINKEEIENETYKSRLYYSEKNKKITPEHFVFRDVLSFSKGLDLLRVNPLEAKSKLTTENKEKRLSDWDLRDIYHDDTLKKTPEDILKMIENGESQKKIYKHFVKNYESKILNAALSIGTEEGRLMKVYNAVWEEKSQKAIENIKTVISQFKNIEEYIKPHEKEINEIVSNTLKQFNEFNDDIDYEFFTRFQKKKIKQSNWYNYGEEAEVYKEIEESSFLRIYPSINTDNCLKDFRYLNSDTFKCNSESDRVFFCVKTQNEIVGFLSLYKESENVLHIGTASISGLHRKKGLMTKLYDQAAEYAIKNNIIITNSHYSDDGKQHIPKIKNKLSEKYPDILFLDQDCRRGRHEVEVSIADANKYVISLIKKEEKNFNVKEFSKSYKKHLALFSEKHKQIDTEQFGSYVEINKLKDEFVDNLKKDIQNQKITKKLKNMKP